jgi:uncharacterized membrane protein
MVSDSRRADIYMASPSTRLPAGLAFLGSLLGLYFALTSTLDYAAHLDRGMHDLHCSIVPGAAATVKAEACRAAMYSPYSAIFKSSLWGGLPIALFALGAFTFFAVYAAYLWHKNHEASRFARRFFALVSVTPLLVSLVMLTISLREIGSLCLTCVGIYISSLLVSVGGLWGLRGSNLAQETAGPKSRPIIWAIVLLDALGIVTILPAVTYATTAPDHTERLKGCGALPIAPAPKHGLLAMRGSSPKKKVLFFEDPLCPTCRGFHSRLTAEGLIEKMDAEVVLFPLDSECNWMLGEPLHPGACMVSRALLCAVDPKQALTWIFDHQTELAAAGKSGEKKLEALLQSHFGPRLKECMGSTKTKQRLNAHLHYAAENSVPLATPQMYLGTERVCDEDTDIGLSFALKHLAPELYDE